MLHTTGFQVKLGVNYIKSSRYIKQIMILGTRQQQIDEKHKCSIEFAFTWNIVQSIKHTD